MANSETVLLPASARVTDADYPGVLKSVGPDWRLAVNMDSTKYLIQKKQGVKPDGSELWNGYNANTLAKLVQNNASRVVGLAEACDGLPDDPGQAAPEFKARRELLLECFAATDWRLQEYGRVILQDGNIRLVVEPSGELYRLQCLYRADFLAGSCDKWRTFTISPSASDIVSYIFSHVRNTHDWSADPCPALLHLLGELPELARDGSWPSLPERPVY